MRNGGRTLANGEDAVSIASSLWKSVFSYASFEPPLVIVAGDADTVVNNAVHGAMLSRLTSRSRLVSLRGCGHMLHHFHQQAVVDAVDEVLAAAP